MKKTALLHIYSGLMRIAAPFLPLYLKRRVKAGKEDPLRLKERYGQASRPRPNGPLIWVHGASVGETLMTIPIIDWIKLNYEGINILVTSGTKTSADILESRLPDSVFHQYLPADVPAYAARFTNHWKPDLCLWAESDLWPNLISAIKAQNTPMVLLNARLSEKSRIGWLKRPKTAKAIFSAFNDILIADKPTGQALSEIFKDEQHVFGNIKMAVPPLPVDANEVIEIKKHLNNGDIWCAASTHPGEDQIILAAHAEVLEQYPNARLILVPRHPERADDIAALIGSFGFKHSRWGTPLPETGSVYLVDQMGKLGPLYLIADTVVMGGSLLPHLKGHNPLEPAHMSCAIVSGPYVSSFQQIYNNMNNIHAATRLDDVTPQTIAEQVIYGFEYPENRMRYASKAQKFSAEKRQILLRLSKRLAPFISSLNRL